MTAVRLAPEVVDDFERILDHLVGHGANDAPERVAGIVEAIDLLQASPLIGRPARGGKRELVIGTGSRGYVALYRYVTSADTVIVLAVRAQREDGFKRRPRK